MRDYDIDIHERALDRASRAFDPATNQVPPLGEVGFELGVVLAASLVIAIAGNLLTAALTLS